MLPYLNTLPTEDKLMRLLDGTAVAVAARALLSEPPAGAGSIVTLPSFAWTETGNQNRMMNKITWECPGTALFVPADETMAFGWQVEDSTLPTVTGVIELLPDGYGGHTLTGTVPASETMIAVTPVACGLVQATIRRTAERGEKDLFELIQALGEFVTKQVGSASRRVYRELTDCDETAPQFGVLDDVELQDVIDGLMYGTDGEDVSSITRLLRRVAVTDLPVKKSVPNVLSIAIRSAAESRVRRKIGDPHLGRLIRKLARRIGSTDPEEVLARFRSENPTTGLGIDRVRSALTAGATANASAVPLIAGAM